MIQKNNDSLLSNHKKNYGFIANEIGNLEDVKKR
jgi:hypothetical protein